MKLSELESVPCPVAQAVSVIGDPWTILILRDAFRGESRFDGFQQASGVSRAILAERLARLVDNGLMQRVADPTRPSRHIYTLSPRGRALQPVFMVLADWSETQLDKPVRSMGRRHKTCGHNFRPVVCCSACGDRVDAAEVTYDRLSRPAPAA